MKPKELYPALSPRQAEVYYHYIDRERSHEQIGELLGISPRTSETLYYRACKKIEKMKITMKNLKD